MPAKCANRENITSNPFHSEVIHFEKNLQFDTMSIAPLGHNMKSYHSIENSNSNNSNNIWLENNILFSNFFMFLASFKIHCFFYSLSFSIHSKYIYFFEMFPLILSPIFSYFHGNYFAVNLFEAFTFWSVCYVYYINSFQHTKNKKKQQQLMWELM